MINYDGKKGYGLIQLIEAMGHSIALQDGKWVSSDDAAVQALIDGFDPMPTERQRLLTEVNHYFGNLLDQVTNTYPQAEVQSWAKQETEARDFIEFEKPSKLLTNLANSRGIPVELLAEKVVEKADAYAVVVGQILGQRQKTEQKIEAAETLDDLAEITYK